MNPTDHTPKLSALRRRLRKAPRDAGQAVTEILMYSAIIVGVIVVVGAALQALGVDIIAKISSALGI
jgi:small-conductance mechanosensitive channel